MRDFGREIVWIDSLLCDERRFSRREGRFTEKGYMEPFLTRKEGRKDCVGYGDNRRGSFEHGRDFEGLRFRQKSVEKGKKTTWRITNEDIIGVTDNMEEKTLRI